VIQDYLPARDSLLVARSYEHATAEDGSATGGHGSGENEKKNSLQGSEREKHEETSGYTTWFTAGGAIRIAHYDVIDDIITRKL